MVDECIKCCKPMGKDMNRIALGNGFPVWIHKGCEKKYWEDRAKRDAVYTTDEEVKKE